MKLNEDGTVHLLAGMSEIGSGSNTAMVQIAAEVLGVEADAVALVSGDTETTPFDMLTAASRVTVSVGNAVHAPLPMPVNNCCNWLRTASKPILWTWHAAVGASSKVLRTVVLPWASWYAMPRRVALVPSWDVAPSRLVCPNPSTPLARRLWKWRWTKRPAR